MFICWSRLPDRLAVMILSAAAVCQGQSVQLPVIRQFQVSTTVSVPDRGTAVLGGVGYSSQGVGSRSLPVAGRLPLAGRPFRGTAIGGNRTASQVQVGVTILDLDAMDRAILNEARQRRGGLAADGAGTPPSSDQAAIVARARYLSTHVGRRSAKRK